MSKLSRLTLCLLSIVMVSIPLFDILSNIMDLNRINVISIVILIIILISLLICSALWLYIEWRDLSEEEQLHQERLKYTSPDLLGEQTKVCLGLHNSSSLYKITIAQRGVSRFEDGCQNAEVGGQSRKNTWLTSYLRNPDLQLSWLEQQTHNLEVQGSSPCWSTRRKRMRYSQ